MTRLILLLFTSLAFTACRTPRQRPADLQAQQRTLQQQQEMERQRLLNEERRRTQLLIEDNDVQMRSIQPDIQQTRSALSEKANNRDIEQLEKRLSAIERQLQDLERKRAQDREEIIEILSQRMAKVMASQQPAASPSRSHVVAQGETISTIASAYRVSSQAIIRANNITNPNTIRIGQTLIIP
jgi:LysM repeat protein